jgi:hypothetical protein
VKAGIFWFGPMNDIVLQGIKGLQSQSEKNSNLELDFLVQGDADGTCKIGRIEELYPYDAVNALVHAYHKSIELNLDFAIVNFRNAVLMSLVKLEALLRSQPVQETIFSFRIAEIMGIGQKGSPRLPLIDENFIILNIKKACEKKLFERPLINASHFSHVGYNHATLLSFIEYALHEGEFNNHFDEKSSFDKFGNLITTIMEPFHYCSRTGCLTAYPELEKRLTPLVAANITAAQAGGAPVFLKQNILIRWLNYLKAFVYKSLPNYELRKTYSSN